MEFRLNGLVYFLRQCISPREVRQLRNSVPSESKGLQDLVLEVRSNPRHGLFHSKWTASGPCDEESEPTKVKLRHKLPFDSHGIEGMEYVEESGTGGEVEIVTNLSNLERTNIAKGIHNY